MKTVENERYSLGDFQYVSTTDKFSKGKSLSLITIFKLVASQLNDCYQSYSIVRY